MSNIQLTDLERKFLIMGAFICAFEIYGLDNSVITSVNHEELLSLMNSNEDLKKFSSVPLTKEAFIKIANEITLDFFNDMKK